MSSLTVFNFESHEVRFVGTAEKPEWVASDLVDIFYPEADKRNRSNYLKSIPAKWKGHRQIMTPGGMQTVTTLLEPGLYRLINRSDSPLAEVFQNWLYEEVLPSIRKTGQYAIASLQQPPVQPPVIQQPTLSEIDTVFSGLVKLGIKQELIESSKLTAIAKSIPQLALACEEGKRLLSAQMTVPEVPMSPTELGQAITQKLGLVKVITAQQINQALMNAQLQVAEVHINKQGKKKTEWHITELGQNYGQMQMDTARGHGKTVFHPRWFSSVICVVEEQFGETDCQSLQ